MFKKLLTTGSLLILLAIGFAVIPAHVAHADSCNGPCGQDPVQAGCTASQYTMYAHDFWVGSSKWEIRLKRTTSQSAACNNKAWASLVLISGTNFLGKSQQDIQVYGSYGIVYDILYSSQFQSGAYTNMINYSSDYTCAQYDGYGLNPPPAACPFS